MEHFVEQILSVLIPVCELMGIVVVAVSTVSAFVRYIKGLVTRTDVDVQYELASGLALGLEFKMAAEILKTVLVRDMAELMVLGAVIVLRALMSFLIHFGMKRNHGKKEEKKADSEAAVG